MKKMSLNKTWSECLRMWKWIVERLNENLYLDVCDLKGWWLSANRYTTYPTKVYNHCFFCDYAVSHNGTKADYIDICGYCSKCPAVLVDKHFSCEQSNDEIDWQETPVEFYEKLVELNKKRLEKKGTKNVKVSK